MRMLKDLIDSVTEDFEVTDLRVCAFFTAVVSGRCGLASSMRQLCPRHREAPVRQAGSLLPTTGIDLARLSFSGSTLEASIGLAALNSLIEVDLDRCQEINAAALLEERCAGRKVAVVGSFPFVPRLRDLAEELWVFDLHPDEGVGELAPNAMSELLPRAEVAAISGTTLINHSLEGILALLGPACFKVLLGPTCPLSPRLFDHGLDVLSATVVKDPASVLTCISQGATYRGIKGVRRVSMFRSSRGPSAFEG